MPTKPLTAALLVSLAACAPISVDQGEDDEVMTSTGMVSSGGVSSTGDEGSSSTSTGDEDTSAGSSSTSTGEIEGSSSSTTTGDGSTTDDSTGGDSSTSESAPAESICGNWKVEAGELCDDGDNQDGDGCKGDCSRYDFHGIATDVSEGALVGWKPCWSGTYTMGSPVSGIQESCSGSQLMFACRKVGGAKFGAVAHTTTEDIMTKVNSLQDYNLSNGSAWMFYTPPGEGYIAVGDPNAFAGCQGGYGLCWPLFSSNNADPVFFPQGHCGSSIVTYPTGAEWEKVVLQLQ